jgi:hypothetical protein
MAGAIRSLLDAVKAVAANGATVAIVANAISSYRNTLSVSGGTASAATDAGLTAATNTNLIVAPADENAFVYSRSTTQVAALLTSFFPGGLN